MPKLRIHQEYIADLPAFLALCPFGALEKTEGGVEISAACKMCGLCVKKGPAGAVEWVEEDAAPSLDKSVWRGVAVYVDHVDGDIHGVTYELIGKARELAAVVNQEVCAFFLGHGITQKAQELLHYGVDKVFVYDHPALERFRIQPYTAAFEDFVHRLRPTAVLVGATTVGRQLAPRAAARLRTGLTADCTRLEMNENTDLVQIRPAFGGNIMAQILTPNTRPQMATVRYKVMNAPPRSGEARGEIIPCSLPPEALACAVEVLDVKAKPPEQSIDTAQVLVVAGRGVKKQEDLILLEEVAAALGGQLACTRPMVEAGWMDARRQIGLSGRTVRPRLILTCGVSGAIQFVAGMDQAETIIAINRDERAPIFKAAHYALVGDMYDILPRLAERIRAFQEGKV